MIRAVSSVYGRTQKMKLQKAYINKIPYFCTLVRADLRVCLLMLNKLK